MNESFRILIGKILLGMESIIPFIIILLSYFTIIILYYYYILPG